MKFVAIREGISGPLFRQMLSCALEQHIPKVAVLRKSPGLLQTPCVLHVLKACSLASYDLNHCARKSAPFTPNVVPLHSFQFVVFSSLFPSPFCALVSLPLPL